MKITNVETITVTMPFEAPIRWAFGVRTGTTRTIVKVFTDEDIVGLGETYGGRETAAGINACKSLIVGEDPFKIERLVSKFRGFSGRGVLPVGNPIYFSALEIACWDIIGKAMNTPLYNLLGGACYKKIPFSAFVFYRYKGTGGVGGESSPKDIVKYCSDIMDTHGFKVLKLKGGVLNPKIEIETIKEMRATFGGEIGLRIDPNAIWSVATSIRTINELEKYGLEYVEDPTWNIEGMSQVRKKVNVPLSTNMCVISPDHIPPAIRLGAIDIVLVDLFQWGGILNSKKLAAIAETFQWGLSMHSNAELGVSTAAMLHFAASTPYLTYACDQHYHHHVDDIITKPFKYEDGCMTVPDGPGLGVELDEDKIDKYTRFSKEKGEARHTFDPSRPDWVPLQPSW
ncbi:MAG: mandelate racemase/muconate lactonizing enzyme family protein [Promethearchaeota archaeon]